MLTYMLRTTSPRRLIATLYQYSQKRRGIGEVKARVRWQEEMSMSISDMQWTYCCSAIRRVSSNSRHRLVHFKYIQRVYYTPQHLYQYGLRDTSACPRCGMEEAGFLHVAWSCTQIQEYWTQVIAVLQCMVDKTIE